MTPFEGLLLGMGAGSVVTLAAVILRPFDKPPEACAHPNLLLRVALRLNARPPDLDKLGVELRPGTVDACVYRRLWCPDCGRLWAVSVDTSESESAPKDAPASGDRA